ncbi:conserved hypothetical protein [Rhodospirillaceae bacterium LM-1]|nr:conserved hypothetical protein [Rhodospirillaceae bacterium LM-1]
MFDLYPDITKERVEKLHALTPKRISFAYANKEQPRRSSSPYIGIFTVSFVETIGLLFNAETGLDLYYSPKNSKFIHSFKSENDFLLVSDWVRRQGTRHFLRDCLELSVALDQNLTDNQNSTHTQLGKWESMAKGQFSQEAIAGLVGCYVSTIRELPFYRDTRYIAAVPPRPGKLYDLPSTLAAKIAEALGIENLTTRFSYAGQKGAIKTLSINDKWAAWEQAGLSFSPALENRPSIILIDDKYQSGITLQFVASKLRAAGAGDIYGLCAVKTLRDDDNQ